MPHIERVCWIGRDSGRCVTTVFAVSQRKDANLYLAKSRFEGFYISSKRSVFTDVRPDLIDRVHDRGVVSAAEVLADFPQRAVGPNAAKEHADLAWQYDRPSSSRGAELLGRHGIVFTHRLFNGCEVHSPSFSPE